MPSNSQNDHVYVTMNAKHDVSPIQLLKKAKKRFIMVSVAISKVRKTSLIFVQPGAEVNSASLGFADLLPDIHRLPGNNFMFQQDGAVSH